jgi:hypothetical protein
LDEGWINETPSNCDAIVTVRGAADLASSFRVSKCLDQDYAERTGPFPLAADRDIQRGLVEAAQHVLSHPTWPEREQRLLHRLPESALVAASQSFSAHDTRSVRCHQPNTDPQKEFDRALRAWAVLSKLS